MKSRKKVLRKKEMHKTRTRKSLGRSKRRTKCGGMIRSARAVAGTLLYYDILPLIRAQQIIYRTGHDPQPADGSITNVNERFYRTFADIPADDGLKTSIEELRKELEDPVKNADKMKSIKEKYDAIMKKLDEEKRKQSEKQPQGRMMVVGKAFTPSPSARVIASGAGAGASPFSKSYLNNQDILSVVKPPFSSPDSQRYRQYSTEQGTPAKLPSKSELSLHQRPVFDHNNETKTPSKILFGTETPISSPHFRSPPPPDQIINHENQKPQLLLSPDHTGILKKLDFSNTYENTNND
jgi:hypothetical protein